MYVTNGEKKTKRSLSRRADTDNALLLTCLVSVALTVLIIIFRYIIQGFAPFGDRANIFHDAQHQMLDLLCWYKDVLSGNSSIDYTFTKSLGGSNFVVFSYYLASPLNLLVVFFDKTQIPLLMNLLFVLKCSFAAIFACYYINFKFKPDTRNKYVITVFLAVSYALSHYLVTQTSALMWLDGAVMLPLILAGVEKLISGKKSTLFIISCSLAMLFNWYCAFIDLMFAGLWFLFECARLAVCSRSGEEDASSEKFTLRSFGLAVLRFAVSCISVLMIASALLLPTLALLMGRTYGSSGLSMLKDLSFIGFIPNIISNYSFGIASVKGGVNLFAGTVILFGTVFMFMSSAKALKEKLVYGAFLAVVVLTYYWQPLVALFSMLRIEEALWYRWSFTGTFTLIYLAAIFFFESDHKKLKFWMPLSTGAVYALLVFLTTVPNSPTVQDITLTNQICILLGIAPDYYAFPLVSKLLFPVVFAILTTLLICFMRAKRKDYCSVISVILVIVSVTELTISQIVLSNYYSDTNTPYLRSYTEQETALLKAADDSSFHRVVQTSYHSLHNDLPASYNESMAYGFASVTSFVSAPDENSVVFLDRAGYKSYYYTIPVTVSENLALDSLLSVKYVMLPSGDANNEGLVKIAGTDGFKDLYQNPYAVPAAFVISCPGDYDSTGTYSTQYLNNLYRQLSGIDKDVFVPLGTVDADELNSEDSASLTYRYSVSSDPDTVVYAELLTDTDTGAVLSMNGAPYTSYSTLLAPSLVRVHSIDGKAELELEFTDKNNAYKVTEARFYALDLKTLEEVTSAIRNNAALNCTIEDGHCMFETDGAASGQSLFTSIPYSKGWTITRNGKKIDCEQFASTFMTIPLEEGHNVIEMSYTVPYKTTGLLVACAGILLLAGITFFENRKKKD